MHILKIDVIMVHTVQRAPYQEAASHNMRQKRVRVRFFPTQILLSRL